MRFTSIRPSLRQASRARQRGPSFTARAIDPSTTEAEVVLETADRKAFTISAKTKRLDPAYRLAVSSIDLPGAILRVRT